MATVTRKGQITLPKDIRDVLGLSAGSKVVFKVQDGRVILEKVPPTEALRKWRGYLRTDDNSTTDDLMKELRGE
jgi:AbrB family looped-hinge helix DNA binding protein